MSLSPPTPVEPIEQGLRDYLEGRSQRPDGVEDLLGLAGDTREKLVALAQEQLVLELSEPLRDEIRGYILAALDQLSRVDLDADDEVNRRVLSRVLVELEAGRHILRDALDHEALKTLTVEGSFHLSQADVVRHLAGWLPRISRAQQAALLGIDTRTLTRWKTGTIKPATWRAEMVVDLAGVLRHSWTDEGVFRWFERPHPMLGGRRAMDLLAEGDAAHEQDLLLAARGGRAQTAA